MGRSAIILGPTGLTGTELLKQLLVDSRYSEVKAFTRRSINIKHKKLKQYIVDFDLLDQHKQDFTADDVFCCLGTTMKKAKTKSQFRKVDFEIPSLAAQMALGQGAKQLMLISALGSNPSSIFFL